MSSQEAVTEWARQMSVAPDIATEVFRLAEASKVSDLAGVMALGRLVMQERNREQQEASSQRNPEAEPIPSAMERLRIANRQNAHRDMRAERKQRNGR